MINIKTYKKVLILFIGIFILFGGFKLYRHITYEETVRYELAELSNGIYVKYQKTFSRVPSENYEIITFCVNGRVMTLNGNINISYLQEDGLPYIVWTRTNLVHGDTIDVYVQQDKLEYLDNMNIK